MLCPSNKDHRHTAVGNVLWWWIEGCAPADRGMRLAAANRKSYVRIAMCVQLLGCSNWEVWGRDLSTHGSATSVWWGGLSQNNFPFLIMWHYVLYPRNCVGHPKKKIMCPDVVRTMSKRNVEPAFLCSGRTTVAENQVDKLASFYFDMKTGTNRSFQQNKKLLKHQKENWTYMLRLLKL